MASNEKLLSAIRLYLERLNIAVGGGGRPIFYDVGKIIPAASSLELDIKTVFPEHADYELLSASTEVRVLEGGRYVTLDPDVTLTISNDGVVKISNRRTTSVVVQYQVTSPAVLKFEDPPEVKFLGEVPTAGFIDGLELASAIGLTAGTAQHSDSPWLHFVLDGVELYVAKKPYRYSLSWDHINATGAVFGTKTVTINGSVYKVRLLKTVANGNIYTGVGGHDPVDAYGSEWSRLMYPIHSGNHTNISSPSPVSGEGIRFGSLAQYTDTDLVVHSTAGSGSWSWCQETPSDSPASRVCRGYFGVSYLLGYTASFANSGLGWRPVLELVG